MAVNYKEIVVAQTLTASPLTYYTVPSITQTSITAVSVSNPTGAPVLVRLYRVPVAGSAGATTLIATRTVPAGATLSMPDAINHKLTAGSQLFADGLACTLNISGVEFIPGT